MIVASTTDANKLALWEFMRRHGVPLAQSSDFQAIGRLGSDNELIGVVAFNGFVGKTASVHTAGIGNWVSRDLIRQTFHYPFVQLGLNHLIATVAANNERALRFDQRIGFKEWVRLPDGFDTGVDLVVLKMSREECKWVRADAFERKAA